MELTQDIPDISDKPELSGLPTIAAVATPLGRGGVGVIRLSGDRAYAIACALTGKSAFTPRMASFCRFYQEGGMVVDEGLVLYFKGPNSFTGEDVIELQGHGGVILQNQLLARVFELGAKQAGAGEFSYRAFDNDKLDLVQAEAIADAIDATSAAAASSAIRSLSGEFSQKINQLLEQLIHLRLHVEAAIDFPDEEDVDFLSDGVIQAKLEQTQAKIQQVLATAKQGQLLRDGIHVVLAGRPNAGKSSLLNRLAGQDRAIVTDVAGTTRDTLQETVVLNGLTLHLTDTAGLRETEDTVERIGIERAHTAITQADMLLMVYDVTRDLEEKTTPLQLAEQLFGELPEPKRLLIIANKSDLLSANDSDMKSVSKMQIKDQGYEQVDVSCETGTGIDELVETLCDKVGFHPPENSLIARTRHIDALKRTADYLAEAHDQLTVFQAGELVAESLRQAQISLGEITGEFSADDLLGKIFGSFCIGK
ncbi:tRNA uridine-5-carboxymethylaminomethyl(34) synthesis GTPase MnmE [Psychrobacter sp.]|uniref:tRNA uridine-5-carboxymethylaminomethyl(34) synthesis GTPase MnmE n=1 Tax=Psychrobacter sp. TaxID=56811 RepID=UPI00264987F8|nr:tRNA uridine-5-carboxymethylaminomethyl(34) synthesis GTPase MnmE [Psychrobacter sp.]MDN6276071.1 tRNA uridine-5-carboxymethylaminomethyl(34) synthesis GTPase MnmE [Psychrobacter sp.]MDN6308478.1 tRNA uridine-5-carboxymethylaminomethyl(34) synthesis GTPase MnmE [Psychrobacter sp.]